MFAAEAANRLSPGGPRQPPGIPTTAANGLYCSILLGLAAARPRRRPLAARIQLPALSGEVTLNTRSMYGNAHQGGQAVLDGAGRPGGGALSGQLIGWCSGSGSGLRMASHDSRPPAAQRAAAMVMAVRNPAAKRAGSRASAPEMPAATGSTATASSPAVRATSLLTAEAIPACSAGAAASTVEVSGATVRTSPSPYTSDAGRMSTR